MLDSSDVETETCPPFARRVGEAYDLVGPAVQHVITVTTTPGGLIDAPRSTDTVITCSSCSSSSVKVSV